MQEHKVVLAHDSLDGLMVADAIKFEVIDDLPAVYADGIKLVSNDGQDINYVHADHLGAPQKMTDKDRVVVWDASFLPFGEEDSILGSAANDNRFPGQRLSSVTGLHYNYWRDYDPTTGRYLQSDPIGLAGGINTYGYVHGNPVNYVDPFGLYCIPCVPPAAKLFVDGVVVGLGLLGILENNKHTEATKPTREADNEKPAICDATPGDLCEQLALASAKAGAGKIIERNIGDEPRLVAHYGPGPWVKKAYNHKCPDGKILEIHYFSNLKGLNVELKFK